MGKPIEYLELEACGIPCEGCPVASLSEEERYAVDRVLQNHGPEIEYDPEIYPWNDAEADAYQIHPLVTEWAGESLGMAIVNTDPDPKKVTMVARAVTKIANEGCPTYSEGA